MTKTVAVGRVCIAVATNGPDGPNDDWRLLKPAEVPEWLKNPDVLGTMLQGNLAHDDADPESGWYCAVRLADPAVDANVHPEANADGAPQIVLPGSPRLAKAPEPEAVAEAREAGGVELQH